MITLNMKQNRHAVVKLWRFQDFYIKPRLLINMHDIDTKNNRAHLRGMGYLGTKYVMYTVYGSSDIVFTS